ncbi:MAG: hypothetical protein NVS3B18_09900 [Candidatus Dormibacteria bacterium]
MNRVRAFALFWWDFIVGDDYRIAVGVVVMLGTCAGFAHLSVSAWWLPPLFILAVLGWSVARAAPHR